MSILNLEKSGECRLVLVEISTSRWKLVYCRTVLVINILLLA